MPTIEHPVDPKCSVLLVDDDDLSREVLTVLLAAEGYRIQTAASGDEALTLLSAVDAAADFPTVILADLQMPGLAGSSLAVRLRAICGPAVSLLVMSAGDPPHPHLAAFDGFLRKPFAADALTRALARSPRAWCAQPTIEDVAVLDETVYARLAVSMPAHQLTELYALCLADAMQRIERLRVSACRADDSALRKEAHTLRGGCAMAGARQLSTLAARLEAEGIAGRSTPELEEYLDRLVDACASLQSMLNTRAGGMA